MFGFFNGFANGPGRGVDHNAQHPFAQFPGGSWGLPPPPPPPAGPTGPHPPHPPPPPGPAFDWNMWFDHDDAHHGHGRRHGRRGHRHHRHGETSDDEPPHKEKAAASPETMDQDAPDPEEVAPEEDARNPPPYWGWGGRGGRFGMRGGRGRGPHCRRRGGAQGFDFPGMMRGFMQHPFFQNLQGQNRDENDAFQPPVDIFNTSDAYVVHVALPGANKDDVGVNWNADEHALSISGVVHRPGDEQFIQALVSGERRVGLFERTVTLPPAGVDESGSDIDVERISAKMEAGVLVVTVPKVEKEWTEVRKVDIQ